MHDSSYILLLYTDSYKWQSPLSQYLRVIKIGFLFVNVGLIEIQYVSTLKGPHGSICCRDVAPNSACDAPCIVQQKYDTFYNSVT